MEDLQNGVVEETQRSDLRREGEKEVIDAVQDVKPEVEVSTDERDLSFDDGGSTREEESNETGSQIESFEEAKEVFESVIEAVEPVQSLSAAVTSMDGKEEKDGSSTVAVEVEQQSSSSMDLPETGSVLPSLALVCEEFQESTLSNVDENSNTAPAERDVDLKGTDNINGQDLDDKTGESSATGEDKTQENAENCEVIANENIPQIESSNGNHAAAEMPKTTPVISVAKRTSFLGCCGFLEVLRRSGR